VRGSSDIYIAPSDSFGALRPFIATSANEVTPDVSPDGRWIAYTSDESQVNEIYVQALPGPGPRLQVSVNGGIEPVWDSNGTLFYRTGQWILSASIGGSPLRVLRRDSLFADKYALSRNSRTWDVFPSGREFLFLRTPPVTAMTEIMVVLNWQQMPGPQRTDSRER
jgi:hypothetical protein